MLTSWCVLALLALLPSSQSANPGVKVGLTQKGLEYGRQIGMATLQRKLNSIQLPDMSGKSKVKYSLTGMKVTSVGLPNTAVGLVPGAGLSLSIENAFISIHGNYRIRWKFIRTSGSFDLSVSGLSITSQINLQSDKTGRPTVSSANCVARVGSLSIKIHGRASWLLKLFRSFLQKALREALEKKICPLVADAVSDMNPRLQTLNVLAKVDKYAEIEYSMVASPVITKEFINFDLKGAFYNIGKHQEPPFVAPPFSLLAQPTSMLYFGVSSFTVNSAGFVYNNAGILSLDITDDMIPPMSPFRLNTKTFGALLPQIAERFPNLKMKLLVKTSSAPNIIFEPDNMTLRVMGTMTAYAIQTNGDLAPLFIINLDASVSARAYITGVRLAGAVTLNKIGLTVGTSHVGPFQVKTLETILQFVLKVAVVPLVNVRLQQGFPLPTLDKMNLVNPQLHIQKNYMLIGTDVHFDP